MIMKLKRLLLKYQEVFLYIFWGGCTTVVNIGVFAVLVNIFQVYYQTANILAWLISVTFAYLTNRVWVFKSHYVNQKQLFTEALRFYASRLGSLGVELIIVYMGVKIFHMDVLLVKVIDNVVVVILNYVLSKLVIFNRKNNINI